MSKNNNTVDRIQAVWNILGGDDGVDAILNHRVRVELKVTHTVDLGASPRLPFEGAEVFKHEGEGLVELELGSDDNLYVNNQKIVLYLSERQKGNGRVTGHEIRRELEDGSQGLLNSNVLDYIFSHPELFPKHWRRDENDDIRFIFFWGSIFRSGSLSVRFLYWDAGGLYRDYNWLGDGWGRRNPSASLALD